MSEWTLNNLIELIGTGNQVSYGKIKFQGGDDDSNGNNFKTPALYLSKMGISNENIIFRNSGNPTVEVDIDRSNRHLAQLIETAHGIGPMKTPLVKSMLMGAGLPGSISKLKNMVSTVQEFADEQLGGNYIGTIQILRELAEGHDLDTENIADLLADGGPAENYINRHGGYNPVYTHQANSDLASNSGLNIQTTPEDNNWFNLGGQLEVLKDKLGMN